MPVGEAEWGGGGRGAGMAGMQVGATSAEGSISDPASITLKLNFIGK